MAKSMLNQNAKREPATVAVCSRPTRIYSVATDRAVTTLDDRLGQATVRAAAVVVAHANVIKF